MNGRDRRRSWPRWATILGAMALTGLLATACGSDSSSSTTGKSTRPSSAVAYSACMRSHGVPRFPDPDSKGNFQADPEQLGVSSTRYQASEQACQHLLPTGGSLQQQTNLCLWFGDCPPALLQQLMDIERKYAQCMRSHGVPRWPDPTIGKGRPVFDVSAAGIDPQSTSSSRFRAADGECRGVTGGSVPRLPTS